MCAGSGAVSRAGGVPPLPPGWAAARSADWLDRLWAYPDLAPAPAVRQERDGTAACVGEDPRTFFPEPWEMTTGGAVPSGAERRALAICGRCPVLAWCLERDLNDSSTPSKILGVRAGLRQGDRRALYLRVFGRRPKNGAAE
ncbi:WhiB family transcriptional regulator [Streptomyces yangpuensis]|uniref:WhiB family transcriptional regulator n=1 Tax=Streptomyces yangpuensis TaxID=1648182 RepID=UPI0027E395C2|nr:WhiB family transcriptional regulator [Streptomyces yangpuensis]